MSKEIDSLQTPTLGRDAGRLQELAMLQRAVVVRSRTNPRTHFDPDYIKELAASIAEHGVLQPILVRPLPAARLQDTFQDRAPGAPLPTHEIVCGECRWRAAEGVVDQIPVLIRILSDIQVLQVQLVENLRRKDLHPLEEAEGFERLMKDHGMSVEDIAAKVGKSASQIYVTLKLLELTPECRQELYAGKLTRSTALLVARAPAYLQAQIARDIMAPDFNGESMTYRRALQHIQQHYMLQLANAVFDIKDAHLVAKAGACTTCAKNTGANSDMFADVKGGDTCTDPKCFDAKKVAHFAAVAKAAAAKGQKVIQGKEAKELIANEYATPKGYELLDSHSYINSAHTTLRKVIGKDGPTPVLIVNPYTKALQEALPTAVANKLIKQAQQAASRAKAAADKNKEPSKQDLERQFANTWHDKAVEQIHGAIMAGTSKGITVALARRIAMHYASNLYGDAANRFARLFDVSAAKVATSDGIDDFLSTCPDATVGPALLVLMIEEEFDEGYGRAAGAVPLGVLELVAGDCGVDIHAAQEQAKTEMKAAAAARKLEADAKAGAMKHPANKPAGKKKIGAADAKAGISKALQAAKAIKGIEGVTAEVLQSLTKAGVLSLDELADLTVDELSDITCLTAADARAVITKAREHWFGGDAQATGIVVAAGVVVEVEPASGCRVRIKDGLKNKKICGHEATLVSYMGTKWFMRFDAKVDGKSSTTLDRNDFVVIADAAPAAAAKPGALKPMAAWPFPTTPR